MTKRTAFWMCTGLLAVVMLGSAARMVLDPEWARESFERLGYPAYLIRPLSIVKLLGMAAILTNVSPRLRKLAQAGFFYHLLIALSAHVAAGDPPVMMTGAVAGLVLLLAAYALEDERHAPQVPDWE